LVERQDGARRSLGRPIDEASLEDFSRALLLVHQGRNGEARDLLTRAHSRAPESGHIAGLLGELLLDTAPDEAFELLSHARTQVADASPVETGLALYYLRVGQPQKAVNHARAAVLLAPQSERSRATYRRALVANGEEPRALELDLTHSWLRGESPTRVVARLDENQLLDRESPEDQALLLEFLMKNNLSELRGVTKGVYTDGELAVLLLRYGQARQARELASARLQADPDDACAQLAWTAASERLGTVNDEASLDGFDRCADGEALHRELLLRRARLDRELRREIFEAQR
jgi:tetratricopeptide (TPR) repeat protein